MAIMRFLPLLTSVILASYIFYDCYSKKKPVLGIIFGLSAFIPIPIGPILYFLLIKPNLKTPIKKPNQTFCSKCGFSSNSSFEKCPNCQNSITLS